jgi:hypothetical protein
LKSKFEINLDYSSNFIEFSFFVESLLLETFFFLHKLHFNKNFVNYFFMIQLVQFNLYLVSVMDNFLSVKYVHFFSFFTMKQLDSFLFHLNLKYFTFFAVKQLVTRYILISCKILQNFIFNLLILLLVIFS